MKKKLLLLFLPMLLLTGCNNSSGGAIPAKEREVVALSDKNYSQYIAVYTTTDSYGSSGSITLYRYQLVGSSLCKFNDCKITYTFVNQKGELSESYSLYEIKLTLSGCGESIETSVSNYGNNKENSYYCFKVISASGTVEILY